jgi:lipopolysaccharide assembly outer membrane protein LptD (OstA)
VRRSVAAWIALLLWCAPAAADDVGGGLVEGLYEPGQELDLRADSVEYESGRKLYVARGNVRIRQGPRELRADWMAFSEKTRRGVASGQVYLSDGEDTLTASFVEFDMDTLEGIMFDAEFVNRETLELRGGEIQKTGEQTYRFRDGEFTSCTCPDPAAREPWQLSVDEAELEVDGYGTARNAKMEILGVPMAWLPWMIYPLKTTRQSGILFPDFTLSGRNGFEVGLPIFIAAGDPVNLTLTPRWLSKRGPKGDLELEYVVGEQSGGDAFGAYLYDQDVNADTRKTPFGKHRWTTLGSHDFQLPAEWRIRTDYAFVSDNAYANDFEELSHQRSDRFLTSTGSISGPLGASGGYGLVGAARYATDLQNPDDTDRDDFLLNRLPEVGFHALPAGLPFADWLVPALDAQYIYFHQIDRPQDSFSDPNRLVTTNGRFFDTGPDGIATSQEDGRTEVDSLGPDPNFDDNPLVGGGAPGGLEGDGFFQDGELLADDGHRATFTPRLGAPLRIFDALELYPEVGWYETLYGSDAQGFERRGFLTGRADLRTRLRGRLGKVTHLLEPRLGWALVMDTSQRGNPLYVPAGEVPQQRVRELDLENVTRDPSDRIREFNGLSFALGNRFYGTGDLAAELLADFALSALYDFDRSEFGDIYLDGRLFPFRGSTVRFSLGFDPNDTRVSEGLLGLAFRDDRGDRFSLDYRYVRQIPGFFEAFPVENRRFDDFKGEFDEINQIAGGLRIAITPQWGISYRGAYSFEQSALLGNEGGVEYISKCRCWALRVELRQSRSRGIQVGFRYAFVGLGDDSRVPFETVGRGTDIGFLDGL